jgi:hypothetical protein
LLSRLARQKWIVLTQVTDLQLGMTKYFSGIKLFFTEQDSQQRTFTGSVSADEPHLDVLGQGGLCVIQENLVTIALGGAFNLHQHGHQNRVLKTLNCSKNSLPLAESRRLPNGRRILSEGSGIV